MHHARARPTIATVLTLFVLFSIAGAAEAAFHEAGGRATFSRDIAFTDSEGNVSEELSPDIDSELLYQLGESGSGSLPIYCEAPGSGAETKIYWASPPMFAEPPEPVRVDDAYIRPVTDLNISMGLSDGSGDLGAAGAVATGPVDFLIEVAYASPGASSFHWHGDWSDSHTVAPALMDELPEELQDLGGTPGFLQGPVQFEMTTSDRTTKIDSGSVLLFRLTVTCQEQADFTLDFGSGANMEYIWGDEDDPDTTGGGIPDDWAMYPDGTQWSYDDQITRYGTDPFNPQDHPGVESECSGYTIQEAVDEGYEPGDPSTCPGAGGIPPFLLLVLLVLIVVLVAGGAYGAVTTVNKKVRLAVSHDGFQDIKQGETAQYELTLSAKGKEDEEVPVEISLKGVPEDWSASVDPAHMTLIAGEDPEPVTATLTVTPPPEEEYEAEAVVTVTATPTDEDGKTSPLKPGTSVKTKTIVNIDVEPPEGEKKARKKKAAEKKESEETDGQEALQAEDDEGKQGGLSKMKGAFGRFKKGKKKGEEGEEPAEEGAEGDEGPKDAPDGSQEALKADSGESKAMKKPDLAVGKLAHDPADFSAGDTVTTTVPVKNKGDEPVQGLLLRLYVNDDRVDEKELDLEPGDASEVTFTWTAQPDENRVRVRGGLKEA